MFAQTRGRNALSHFSVTSLFFWPEWERNVRPLIFFFSRDIAAITKSTEMACKFMRRVFQKRKEYVQGIPQYEIRITNI